MRGNVGMNDIRIIELQDVIDIQCTEGNYNCDEYMWGLANGLILAMSVLTRKEPKFLDKPEYFLSEELKVIG